MMVLPQIRNTLPQARWPVLDAEAGCATVALTKGMDRLARAKTSMEEEALRAVLLQASAAAPDALRHDDDLRRQKVERLRAAIASGTYSVSAETLAEKMIEHMAETDSLHADKDIT